MRRRRTARAEFLHAYFRALMLGSVAIAWDVSMGTAWVCPLTAALCFELETRL